jgi:Zn-dependent protease with chaperone function
MKMKTYRHPKETRAMLFTFGTAALLTLALATVTLGCGLLLLGIVMTWGYFSLFGGNNLASYVRVSSDNHPDVWNAVQEARAKWGLGELDVYLNPTPNINASASDFGKDFVIVNYGLWRTITDETQRKFVIGHELGHIGLGHSWLSVIAYQADNAFERSILGVLFQFLLLRYSRMKELSADRIGLLTCGSLDAAIETMAMLELQKANPSPREVQMMVSHLSGRQASFSENMAEMLSTHPDTFERVEELRKFAFKLGM